MEVLGMYKPLVVQLSSEQRRQLERIRDTAPKPYVRERAAAILKIADGRSARDVALHGLLKPRYRETPAGWVHRWQQEGEQGLYVRPGAGRKPAFSPSASKRRGRPRRSTAPAGPTAT